MLGVGIDTPKGGSDGSKISASGPSRSMRPLASSRHKPQRPASDAQLQHIWDWWQEYDDQLTPEQNRLLYQTIGMQITPQEAHSWALINGWQPIWVMLAEVVR